MKRREFITVLGGSLVSWSLTVHAQQAGSAKHLGILMGISGNEIQGQAGLEALITALQEYGWTEGRNLRIDIRWGAADVGRMGVLAKELVALKPDLILGQTTQAVAALQRETNTIPIVFVVVSDPVGSRFVDGFAHPGGNITGFVNVESSLAGKWIEVLKDIVPGVKRAALMFNPAMAPYSAYYLQPFEAAARFQAIEPMSAHVRNDSDLERVIANLAGDSKTGLILMPDAFIATRHNLELIVSLTARHRVPAIYPYRFMVAAGGLISYGIDTVDLYRRSAGYIDRILKGAKPADLPVQLPTRFELAVNLKTAKELGIEMPATLLGRADEVIE
jgi:putative tryptophan/tyrosine transport system substrate-binding protein